MRYLRVAFVALILATSVSAQWQTSTTDLIVRYAPVTSTERASREKLPIDWPSLVGRMIVFHIAR